MCRWDHYTEKDENAELQEEHRQDVRRAWADVVRKEADGVSGRR